ncbi:MAG: bifunctional adenosylcobinamide kinase/adenosylcobinamide-phosphate guanylyltransferase [Sulfurimonas sp.]|nr:bifunctional adenosylcobinamide kinase/adenosylcobinamide-phosphate guanylyltransferase [Sulfurimonas sp.]
MRALFIGGIKSGKSKNAEIYTLKHSKNKPLYLATTEFFDQEMQDKVHRHKEQRGDAFETLEEALYLASALENKTSIVLIECMSMWINNMLYHEKSEEEMMREIEKLSKLKQNLVFVINDVSQGVVSDNALVRKFVEINGRIAQILASRCDEVYNTIAGIPVKIK